MSGMWSKPPTIGATTPVAVPVCLTASVSYSLKAFVGQPTSTYGGNRPAVALQAKSEIQTHNVFSYMSDVNPTVKTVSKLASAADSKTPSPLAAVPSPTSLPAASSPAPSQSTTSLDDTALSTQSGSYVADFGAGGGAHMLEGTSRVINSMTKQWIYSGTHTLWAAIKAKFGGPKALADSITNNTIQPKEKSALNELLVAHLKPKTAIDPKLDLTAIVPTLYGVIKDRNSETHAEAVDSGDFEFALKSRKFPSVIADALKVIGHNNGDIAED